MLHPARHFLKVVVLMALPLLAAVSVKVFANAEKQWQFRVFLDDREIGSHKVKMVSYQDLKQVTVNADFKVKFLFITAFKYKHRTQEVWQGSCLRDLDSTTDNNGENLFVKRQAGATGFKVVSHQGVQELEGCVRSFAYWDLDLLKTDKLLNTQTGEYEDVKVVDLGMDSIEIQGTAVQALHYRLEMEDKSVDLWYTPDKNWLALQSETEDGYQISYYPETMMF